MGKDEFTVILNKPLEFKGKTIKEVEVRSECTAGDLEASDKGKGDVQKGLYLAAELTRQPYAVVRMLRLDDFNRVMEVINSVVGKDQVTGGT